VIQNLRPLVLVADDDPDIVALVRFRLERDGYEARHRTARPRSTGRSRARPTSRCST
jgi:CheY-like chemotaxis protein